MAYGSMSDQLNFLSAEAPEGAGELFFLMDIGSITPGMVLSCNLNVYYVIATNPSEKKVTVYQSYDNSMAEALPVGSPIMIRPRVTDWLLFNYVNNTIRSLSSPQYGLYKMDSWTDDNPGIWNDYAIPDEAANMTSLLRVSAQAYGSDEGWYEIPPNSIKWQPEHGVVRITGYPLRGRTVKFDYRAPFSVATSLTDDLVTDLGLSESMTDIPSLGATVRLLRTTESRRAQVHAQGDPRRADEVPGGQNSAAARDLERDFMRRVNDEHTRLVNRNPWVRQI
jgi:hypothetical protein